MRNRATFLAWSLICLQGFSQKTQVEWFSTSQTSTWTKQKVTVKPGDGAIAIDRKAKGQIVEGVGGCFQEVSWDAV